jgi:glycerol-3-phosphate O-acyltransferase
VSTVYLVDAVGPVEREAVEAWVRDQGDDNETVPLTVPDIEEWLRGGDDPLLAPVRVTWLPADGSQTRTKRLIGLARNARHPGLREQRRIVAADPDRCQVVAGEPATLGELRDRLTEQGGGSLPEFVRLRATLSLERAERSVIGQQYKIPQLVYEEITDSARYRSGVEDLADRLELLPEEVDGRARRYLQEMVASQSRRAIDAWGLMGSYFARAYKIDFASRSVDEVRRLGRRHALVFLPNHRSYLDPLVVRPALLENGFPPNHIMGGINVSFWPLGPIARRSGYVFIRRSFSDNEIYKWALREYMGYLVRKRFNLEWYIEGGRSRTGKLRPPKYGLLTYLIETFLAGGVDDVYLVPVSITYDQLYEVGAIVAEARGAPKKVEGLSWLVGYVRAQGSQRGQVHLAFGEPLSLASALGIEGATLPEAERRRAVQKVGLEVMHRIDSVTPVTATGLVTLSLLGLGDRALTIAEIKAVLVPLLDYVKRRDLPTVGELRLDRAGAIKQVLAALVAMGVVTCYDKGTEPVYQVTENQHLVAAFYRNNIIHFLVNRAVTELVLQGAAEEHYADPGADGWQEALRLRDLLKYEFSFSDKQTYRTEIRAELALIDEQWEHRLRSPDIATRLLEEARPHLAHRILEPYLEAHEVVADRLAAHSPREPIVEKTFVQECLDISRQLLMQQRLTSSESQSLELFSAGLRLARNRGLVEPGGEEVTVRRATFADELRTLVRRLHRSRALALSDLDSSAAAEQP